MSTIVTRAGKGTPLTATDHDNNLNNLNDDKFEAANVGVDIQAWDAQLDDIAALTPTDSNIIVGDGTNWVVETGATARTSLGLTIGTDVQTQDAGLEDISGLAVTDSNIIVGNGTNWVAETGATARTSLGLAIGSDVQAYDVDNLVSDTTASLTAGYTITVSAQGTKSSGTFTPEPSTRAIQSATNGGAHTLAPPTEVGVFLLYYTNNASAGAITTSGFDLELGGAFDTTNTNRFECLISNDGTTSILQITALQ